VKIACEPPELLPPCPSCGQQDTLVLAAVLDDDGDEVAGIVARCSHSGLVYAMVAFHEEGVGFRIQVRRGPFGRPSASLAEDDIDDILPGELRRAEARVHPRKREAFAAISALAEQSPDVRLALQQPAAGSH